MKAASGTSLLLILLFCFEKSLADTCAARDTLFDSCEKINNRRQDQAKNNNAFHQQFLERESRTVNVRERVGTERLVNNRRIVDSDSRLSNYPSKSANDRSANRILSSTNEFNNRNVRVFRIRDDRLDQRVNEERDSRVVRATSFNDHRVTAAFDRRFSDFPETRRRNVRITERLSVMRGTRDLSDTVDDRRNSPVARERAERVLKDESTRRINNGRRSDENALRTNSRTRTPEISNRRVSIRDLRERAGNDALTVRDSRNTLTTSPVARERVERVSETESTRRTDNRRISYRNLRRINQLTSRQEVPERRISIDDSRDASIERDSRDRLTTVADRRLSFLVREDIQATRRTDNRRISDENLRRTNRLTNRQERRDASIERESLIARERVERVSESQPTRRTNNRRISDENLRRTNGLTNRREVRERRISNDDDSRDASIERDSRDRLTTTADRRLSFLARERIERVSEIPATRRTDNRRVSDENLRRTNRRISLDDLRDAPTERDSRSTAANRRQSIVSRERIERTSENESARHLNSRRISDANLRKTNRLANREVTREQRISTGNSRDMSTARDARATFTASPDRRNLLVTRERFERTSEDESTRHLNNRRISDDNLRRTTRQEIRERRISVAESRDASTAKDVAARGSRTVERNSRISPLDHSRSSSNERRETRVNRERDSSRSFSERQLAERREIRINRERDGSRSFTERRDARANRELVVDTKDSRIRNDKSAERRLAEDTQRLQSNVDETSRRRVVRDSHLTRDVPLAERQNRERRTTEAHIKDERTLNQRRVVDDRRLSDDTSRLSRSGEEISNRADRTRVITDGGSRISARRTDDRKITHRSSRSYEGSSRRLQVDGRRTADERESRNLNVRIIPKTNNRLKSSVRDENNNEQHRITERRQYRQISDDAFYKLPNNKTFDFATWSNVITTTLGILLFGHIISTSSDLKKFHQFTSFLNSAKEKVF